MHRKGSVALSAVEWKWKHQEYGTVFNDTDVGSNNWVFCLCRWIMHSGANVVCWIGSALGALCEKVWDEIVIENVRNIGWRRFRKEHRYPTEYIICLSWSCSRLSLYIFSDTMPLIYANTSLLYGSTIRHKCVTPATLVSAGGSVVVVFVCLPPADVTPCCAHFRFICCCTMRAAYHTNMARHMHMMMLMMLNTGRKKPFCLHTNVLTQFTCECIRRIRDNELRIFLIVENIL